ncbi:MAG: lmo0937 family membrane protein [Chloroflexota bacterium]
MLATILWTIFALLVIFWLVGLIFQFGGALINILLAVALVILIYNLLTGRRTT